MLRAKYWTGPIAGGLLVLALLFSEGARDRVVAMLGDDVRNDMVATLSAISASEADTADLVPIAHADVNPYGVNVFLEQEVEEWKIRKTLEMVQAAGFRWVKQQVLWSEIETPQKGRYFDVKNNIPNTWGKYDRIVALARESGLNVILRLDTSPAWARPDTTKEETPPMHFEDYGDFVAQVVSRYKGQVKYYQIWNEPNLPFEWGGQPPDAAAYTKLLSIAYKRAKEADPQSAIISAALAPTVEMSARGVNDLVFLQQMYDEGAGEFFDILGANAYGLRSGPDDRRLGMDSDVNISRPVLVRELMVRNGDAGKPIWAAEMGWSALPQDFPGEVLWGRVTREQQARYTARAFERVQEEWPWLGQASIWHFRMVHDVNSDKPQYYFGIVGNDFEPFPVYEAISRLANAPPVLYKGHHQESHWALAFEGGWQAKQDERAVLGTLTVGKAQDSLRFTFVGSDLDLVVRQNARSGRLMVAIDGSWYGANRLPRDAAGQAYLDLWRAEEQWQQRVPIATGLSWGRHDVEIRVAAGTNGGGEAGIDAVVVMGDRPNVPRAIAGSAALLALLTAVLGTVRLRPDRSATARLVMIGLGRAVSGAGAVASRLWLQATMVEEGTRRRLGSKHFGGLLAPDERDEQWLDRRPYAIALTLGVLLLLAWALRLYRLDGQSLWYDEGTSAALAQRSIAMITRDAAGDIHPPLYYYLLHFWTALTGTSEHALRLLSTLYGLVTVTLTYKLGKRLLGRGVGLLACLFAGVSPVLVYYSQEARMYQQVTALAALSSYLYARLWVDGERHRRRLLWAAYIASTVAMLYTHYFAFTVVLAQNVYFFALWLVGRLDGKGGGGPGREAVAAALSGQGAQLWRWLGGQAVLAASFAPWLGIAYGQLASWPSIGDHFGLVTLLHRAFLVFSFGVGWDAAYTPNRQFALLLLLVAAPLAVLWRWHRGGMRRGFFVAAYGVTPVLAMFALSLQRPMYNPKFLLLAVPAYCIAAGAGVIGVAGLLDRIWRAVANDRLRGLRRAAVAIAVIACLTAVLYPAAASLRGYYFEPKYARDDYRGLATYLEANGEEADAIVLNAPGQIEIFDYYYTGQLERYPLPKQRPPDEASTQSDLEEVARSHRRVWVVLWAVSESDPRGLVERWLDGAGKKEMDRPFGSVRLLRYTLTEAKG